MQGKGWRASGPFLLSFAGSNFVIGDRHITFRTNALHQSINIRPPVPHSLAEKTNGNPQQSPKPAPAVDETRAAAKTKRKKVTPVGKALQEEENPNEHSNPAACTAMAAKPSSRLAPERAQVQCPEINRRKREFKTPLPYPPSSPPTSPPLRAWPQWPSEWDRAWPGTSAPAPPAPPASTEGMRGRGLKD